MLQNSPRPPALRAADNFETTDYNIVWITISKAEERLFVFGLFGRDRETRTRRAGFGMAAPAAIPQNLGEHRVHDPVEIGS